MIAVEPGAIRTPIWDKGGTTAEDWVTRFTVGDDYKWDRLLLPYDVRATRAHAWGLHEIGVLSANEWEDAQSALDTLLDVFQDGDLTVTPEDEDSHTVIERFMTEEAGDVGRKVHTGRSRNDQVLAALRLYLQDALAEIGRQAAELGEALCGVADRHDDVLLPGYTHLQRAMPSTVALWALGYAETLADDLDAVRVARRKVNVSPLGSAAGYGVPVLDLPREAVADRLGFRDVQTLLYTVGFFVLCLASHRIGQMFSRIRLPYITGYLFAGGLVGSFGLDLIPTAAAEQLRPLHETFYRAMEKGGGRSDVERTPGTAVTRGYWATPVAGS